MTDVLSLINSRYGDFVDRIYPIELEINDTTNTDKIIKSTKGPTTINKTYA